MPTVDVADRSQQTIIPCSQAASEAILILYQLIGISKCIISGIAGPDHLHISIWTSLSMSLKT